jgi:small subunit ribosomal protein S20
MAAKPKKKNPRLASGRKRVRQDARLRVANAALRSQYRTAVKKLEKALGVGEEKGLLQTLFVQAQSVIDKISAKGIFHKNKAARDKARLCAKVKAVAQAN